MDRDSSEPERALSGPSRAALQNLGRTPPFFDDGAPMTGAERVIAKTSERLGRIHHQQIERDPWPDFTRFDPSRYPHALRRAAAMEWVARARAEYGSIHQFSAVLHALCEARAGLELLGALSRLVTDEARHVDLCTRMALACDPEGVRDEPRRFDWPVPEAPFGPAPGPEARGELLAWAAGAIMIACCLGETLSRPMLEALVVVTTDPVVEAVSRQILRDEHLHAAFGWDALALLLPALDAAGRHSLHEVLSSAFGGFEATTACGFAIEDIAGREILITRAFDTPNLGTLSGEQFAMIFYATIEQEIIPALSALGLDARRAWAERPKIISSSPARD